MNDNSHATIALVDDEEMVIISIKAFLALETDYAVRGFTDPEDAARFLKESPVDVVVSDYLMPRMNGIQLLARVKRAQPEASRVLLTGQRTTRAPLQRSMKSVCFSTWKTLGKWPTSAGHPGRRGTRAIAAGVAGENFGARFGALQLEGYAAAAVAGILVFSWPVIRCNLRLAQCVP